MLGAILRVMLLWLTLNIQVTSLHAETNTSTKIELQSHMLTHLSKLQVAGNIKFVDPLSESVIDLIFTEKHSMIFEGQGVFVLCTDAVDINGNTFPIDIYVIKYAGQYKTIDVKIGPSARLDFEKMMKAGVFKKY